MYDVDRSTFGRVFRSSIGELSPSEMSRLMAHKNGYFRQTRPNVLLQTKRGETHYFVFVPGQAKRSTVVLLELPQTQGK
jgi:hypothetical protein